MGEADTVYRIFARGAAVSSVDTIVSLISDEIASPHVCGDLMSHTNARPTLSHIPLLKECAQTPLSQPPPFCTYSGCAPGTLPNQAGCPAQPERVTKGKGMSYLGGNLSPSWDGVLPAR